MIMYNFIGKGGVGKTTSASMVASKLSKKGRTLLVSLDPAHNLGDVLGVDLDSTPRQVAPNLWASEPDVDEIIRSYTKKISEELKSHYKYLKVFNLERLFDIVENTPGVEEQALFEEVVKLKSMEEFDYIVIDHAPTGIALRVLLLPEIMLTWTKYLYDLRKEILKRRKIVENVDIQGDPVLKMLEDEIKKLGDMRYFIKGSHNKILLVVNAEEMPVMEALRIRNTLRKFDISVCGVIVNKLILENTTDPTLSSIKENQSFWLKKIQEEFQDINIIKIPYLPRPPKGLDTLKELASRVLGEDVCKS